NSRSRRRAQGRAGRDHTDDGYSHLSAIVTRPRFDLEGLTPGRPAWPPPHRARRPTAVGAAVCDRAGAMAEREDLEFTYTLIDRIVRLSLGELADFSGAKYDGDFSLTL